DVVSAGGALDPHLARGAGPRTGRCGAHARRRAHRPFPVDHAALDRARHPRRRRDRIRRRPRRIRRRHHVRLQHSRRDAHPAAGAVHGAADSGWRCAGGTAGADFAVAGVRGPAGGRVPRAPPAPHPRPLMLRVQLVKRRGDFTLDVDFCAPMPGITALFGRSGCGKSTVISLIAGLLPPDLARVQIGEDVLVDTSRHLAVDARHRRIGVVFQDARLFPHLSVLDNLQYGARRLPRDTAAPIRFDDVVSLLGLEALTARRPHELSGGEKQRVALGRALLAQPRLLLLDEPLASLDLARREEVLPYLERMRDTMAIPIVYVSHQFDEVLRLATRVVLLDAGRVVADGELAEVSRHPALREIVGPDAVGAVISGVVESTDDAGLTIIRVGDATSL